MGRIHIPLVWLFSFVGVFCIWRDGVGSWDASLLGAFALFVVIGVPVSVYYWFNGEFD